MSPGFGPDRDLPTARHLGRSRRGHIEEGSLPAAATLREAPDRFSISRYPKNRGAGQDMDFDKSFWLIDAAAYRSASATIACFLPWVQS